MNYNGGAFPQAALQSLAQQTFRDFEVILLDNASTDGSVAALRTDGLPAFQLVREVENHGFAKGNNIAAGLARGEWLVLMNPDVVANADWLEQVAEGINRHPGVHSFASAQLLMEDIQLMDGAGDNFLAFGIPWRGGYRRPASELPPEGECFSPCGAGAVIERKAFFRVGGFDESFFCYCEDVDLGFRMRLAGESCIFLPRAVIRHAGGHSSDQISGFAVRLGTRNRLWTYLKNMPFLLLVAGLPAHIGLIAAIWIRGLFTGRAGYVANGLGDALAELGPVLRQRKEIQRSRTVTLMQVARQLTWNPLLMLQRRTRILPDRSEGL
ncbi:MAG: glycosyltransferase family 2 protein [Hyphomonas sp.]|nr:glycosyltransferase family 2 protein [Hyphomonas sp.]